MEYNLSVNLVHNSSFTIFTDQDIIEVVELERYTKIKVCIKVFI